MENGIRIRLIIIAAVSAAAVIILSACAWIVFYPDVAHKIPYGVLVSGERVQGLTRANAEKKLAALPRFRPPEFLKVMAGGKQFDIRTSEIKYQYEIGSGVEKAFAYGSNEKFTRKVMLRLSALFKHPNFDIRSSFNRTTITQLLVIINKKILVKPKNAGIDWKTFKVLPHVNGRRLDVNKSMALITSALAHYDGSRLSLPAAAVVPKMTTQKLSRIDFKNPLSRYSTNFNEGKVNRSKNLRRIAQLVTGAEVIPGGRFSYNETVGDRTKENGFYLAPAIDEGQMVLSWGGGACQGSTTIFNAALLGGMTDFEWFPHSRPSHYVNPGRDATVSYGQIDLKFTNPLPESIYIFATATMGIMTVDFYSSYKPKYKIEIRSSWWGRFFPGEQVLVDKSLDPGKRIVISSGASGLQAALWRKYVYPDGRMQETQMSYKSRKILYYPGAKRIVHVGPPE